LTDPAGARGIHPFYSIHPFSIAFIPILGQVTYQKWTALQMRNGTEGFCQTPICGYERKGKGGTDLGIKEILRT
jgi:hypothetical protein